MNAQAELQVEINVDWVNAPAAARWWSMERDGTACWHMMAVGDPLLDFICATTWPAPTFDYSGDWEESLTERPAGEWVTAQPRLLRSAH